ncbi:MAG: hypothetical protein HYX61_08975 [Gammaproteobacteria bacterium]|jgi:hypothetical protein|nr:hypothetical protein [Gammaproteobacteria bacterium]
MPNTTFLNKIENTISKLCKDDGLFDNWQTDEIENKLASLHYYIESLNFNNITFPAIEINLNDYHQRLKAILHKCTQYCNHGEPDFDSVQKIKTLLRQARALAKGLGILLALGSLDEEEDIPEWIHEELFEVYIDPETGESHSEKDTELAEAIYRVIAEREHGAHAQPDIDASIIALTERVSSLQLQIEETAVIDLGDGMRGFLNGSKARIVELQELHEVVMHYFEPTHQKRTQQIAKSAEETYQAQTKKARTTLDANGLNAGELIISSLEALRSVFLLKEPLVEHEEKLSWGQADISIQRKPSSGNRGNLFIRNVGRYGYKPEDGKVKKKDVLDVFNEIIDYCGKDIFNSILAKYGHQPEKITLTMLHLPNNKVGNKLLEKLKQHLFLIFCAEILRYFPLEGWDCQNMSAVKKLPFAMALAIGIELLDAGEIALEDLFEKDATLGPPTGEGILKNSNTIYKKFAALLDKQQEYQAEWDMTIGSFLNAFPQGRVIKEKREYLAQLENAFGDNLAPSKKRL